MNIHIMPVRQFLQLDNLPVASAAIISSSEYLDASRIPIPFAYADYMDFDYESPRSFTELQASEFAEFIKPMKHNVTDLFVCCDAGESRSPAIAAAIHRWLGQHDHHIWRNPKYHPNVLCFKRMADAFDIQVADEEIDTLIYTNRTAFALAKQKIVADL